MENLTQAFKLEWGKFLVSKVGELEINDAKALYELGSALEQELRKLQGEETTKWVAEFNTGTTLLEGLIKTQREETEKKLEAIRTTLTTQQQTAKTEEKSKLPGGIEATITHKAEVKKIRISLDNALEEEFLGTVWAKADILPGTHKVTIQTASESPISIQKLVEVSASTVARFEIKLP